MFSGYVQLPDRLVKETEKAYELNQNNRTINMPGIYKEINNIIESRKPVICFINTRATLDNGVAELRGSFICSIATGKMGSPFMTHIIVLNKIPELNDKSIIVFENDNVVFNV